jgi:hypothetical protein
MDEENSVHKYECATVMQERKLAMLEKTALGRHIRFDGRGHVRIIL